MSAVVIGGRYALGERVAAGAMGALYRAADADGRPFAAKRLLDESHAARFEIEARLLARLRHPRVVEIVDHVDGPEGRFLIMEWIDGENLAGVLASEGSPGLAPDRVVALGLEACEALRYVHEQQVVHRDVKPENLMLAPGRGVVVVDFGIARALDATGRGTLEIGTPGYMAPEAYAGGPFSPRADVYGLAATLWTLLTGEPPPLGARPSSAGLPPSLAAALAAALEPDARARVESSARFAELLGGRLGPERGDDLAASVREPPGGDPELLGAVVRTAAGVFGAGAASLALRRPDGGLRYTAAWGVGADEILGVSLDPGAGIAGAVAGGGEAALVADCRADPRFAAAVAEATGYVPHTLIAVPLRRGGRVVGVLSVLDQRDGEPFDVDDLRRAELFADLAVAALETRSAPTEAG